jgi:N-acetylmuramoyl-L-alanine amidase
MTNIWRIPRLTTPKKKYSKEYKGNQYTIFNGSSNYVYLLDSGHGGSIDGVYQTEGKRSPVWEDGSQLFEGISNRDLTHRITKELESRDISYINLIDNEMDTALKIRTDLANMLHHEESKKKKRRMIYVSIHSDAFNKQSAKGWTVYTSPGQTLSDRVAEIFALKMKEIFPKQTFRTDQSDGDLDKEAKFWVLRKTIMPAILTENFFMTNPNECKKILMNEEGRHNIARLHYEAIQEIDDQKLIG